MGGRASLSWRIPEIIDYVALVKDVRCMAGPLIDKPLCLLKYTCSPEGLATPLLHFQLHI